MISNEFKKQNIQKKFQNFHELEKKAEKIKHLDFSIFLGIKFQQNAI